MLKIALAELLFLHLVLKRQVQKSDRINSDRQSGLDQLGSTRTNSDRIKKNKNKIKLDLDQLGSTKNKLTRRYGAYTSASWLWN